MSVRVVVGIGGLCTFRISVDAFGHLVGMSDESVTGGVRRWVCRRTQSVQVEREFKECREWMRRWRRRGLIEKSFERCATLEGPMREMAWHCTLLVMTHNWERCWRRMRGDSGGIVELISVRQLGLFDLESSPLVHPLFFSHVHQREQPHLTNSKPALVPDLSLGPLGHLLSASLSCVICLPGRS